MAFLLYDLCLLLALAWLIPYYLLRRWCGVKARHGLRERLGFLSATRLTPLAGRPVIWIHAVSVGETRAAIPLLKALRQTYPKHALVLTNVTETGHAIASGLREVDLCLFFPVDLSFVMRRVLTRLAPQLIVIVETEIWPNLVRCANARNIPVLLVNGRISDRSFPRYHKLRRWLAPVLARMQAFCMQSAADADRITVLGAPADRVMVSANLKFDMPATLLPSESPAVLRARYALPLDKYVWVAGSTHAGEEEALLAIYRQLLHDCPELLLVLVPRHPERATTVAGAVRAQGFTVASRSTLGPKPAPLTAATVLVVDTLGEILPLYSAADLVFVGGSLVPVGGHNILEACLTQKPVIFGPYMHNFREISQLVLTAGAGYQIADSSALATLVSQLYRQRGEGLNVGLAGGALLAQHSGATARTMATIQRLLAVG